MNQVEDVNYFIINTIKYYIRDLIVLWDISVTGRLDISLM